jgi:UDP-N-acetylmuramate: L-alanyl-gamma-D-glutamyl-meso-diaminopimelate ligase
MSKAIDQSELPDLSAVRSIHILGICGTAMGTFAGMLTEKGYRVTGSDAGVYPPMSTQLESIGIELMEGYAAENLDHHPDLVIIGNVIRRENPEATAVRARGLVHTSFPRALAALFLDGKHSVVLAGTHGKTTTTSMVAHLLHHAGLDPTFLVGGIPLNFGQSFRVGEGDYVVLEGDEYDTAYFDKVPKFKHYQPHTAVLTSVEFDHADIYDDLSQVEEAFDLLSASVAERRGTLLPCASDVGAMAAADRAPAGLELRPYGGYPGPELRDLRAADDGYHLSLWRGSEPIGELLIPVYGRHNVANALAAYEVGRSLGIDHGTLASGLLCFAGVKRRMELCAEPHGIAIFDDFAHHPTAVKTTLAGVRERHPNQRIFAVFEPRSATSCRKVFQRPYTEAFDPADRIWIAANARAAELPEDQRFLPEDLVVGLCERGLEARFGVSVEAIIDGLVDELRSGDLVVIMSNGSFGGIHHRLIAAIEHQLAKAV